MSTTSRRIVVVLMLATLFVVTIFQPALVGGVAGATSVGLPVAQPSGPTDPREFEAFLDTYLVEQMQAHHIPGVVFTMVKDGRVFFSKGYGYADLETQTPFDPEKTVLTTASLAKAFTAVGVLQLYEQGIVDLDADIRPYLTALQLDANFPEPLTFANLLTHVGAISGMPNLVWGVSRDIAGALNSLYLPAVLALALPVFAALAWIKGWWKNSARVHYTLVTLAVFAGIWWAHYWNLLGFRMWVSKQAVTPLKKAGLRCRR
jgi:CubicO group peptidase (beta-lactamase class C family)